MDLQSARVKLLRTESVRTDRQTRHVLWEMGDTWLEDFEHLKQITAGNDARLRHAVDTAAAPDQRRSASQERMHAARDENDWNRRFSERLARTLAQQRAEPLPMPGLLSELEQHSMSFQRYAADRLVVMQQIALEHHEHRRALGRLSDGDWQKSWGQLMGAYAEQAKVYEQTSARTLPRSFYTSRLEWLRRLRAMQDAPHHEGRKSRVDRQMLREHASAVEAYISQLSPGIPRGVFGGVLAMAAAIIVLVAIFRPATAQPPSAAVRPTSSSAGLAPPGLTLPADPNAANEQGMQLLRQQRCDQAEKLFQQAAEAAQQWHLPHTNRGFCLYELGRTAQAIAEWRTAIKLNSAGQDAHAGLGMALYQTGDREGGLREYQAAITMESQYRDETWLKNERDWSERAIADSRPLRDALRQ